MEILKEHKISISWHNKGKFSAEIINGNITKLHFCEEGKDEKTGPTQCLTSIDWEFLNDVHAALGELMAAVKDQQSELGYSFPTDVKEVAVS